MDGVIVSFDDARGDGLLQSTGGASFYFHCVTIADGSRTIEVGTNVRAVRHVGRLGHDEVIEVRPIS
jgi:cold shock CspA family protein